MKKSDYVAMAIEAMGAVLPTAMPVQVSGGTPDEGCAVTINEKVRVEGACNDQTENLNQPMDVLKQIESVSSTSCSPKQINLRRMLPGIPAARSPTPPSTTASPTAPPPTVYSTPLDAGDSASSLPTLHSAQI